MLTPHDALIYTMVLVSAADRDMTDNEMQSIGELVRHLPVFGNYDQNQLPKAAAACAELLQGEQGLDKVLDAINGALPARLRETAYLVACDIAAADGKVSQEEARLLEMIRYRLEVGRLPAAAIERAARARHQTV
jgi:tellurite resistance protein